MIDLFCMLSTEDKLDGTNYLLCSYMILHILIREGVWNIITSFDVHHKTHAKNASSVVDEVDKHKYWWLNHLHKI